MILLTSFSLIARSLLLSISVNDMSCKKSDTRESIRDAVDACICSISTCVRRVLLACLSASALSIFAAASVMISMQVRKKRFALSSVESTPS